eukprot:scaffold935_cov155-Amphora_coffeaeformis.AAC.14
MHNEYLPAMPTTMTHMGIFLFSALASSNRRMTGGKGRCSALSGARGSCLGVDDDDIVAGWVGLGAWKFRNKRRESDAGG